MTAEGDGAEVRLRLMATSDLHMQILAHDYHRHAAGAEAEGLERLAGLIASLRAEGGASLLLDNGDLLQGNPLGDHLAKAGGARWTHPAIAALNLLGYDAATLGNHDFTFGGAFLGRCIGAADYPVVLANARLPGLGGIVPWVILTRQLTDAAGVARPIRIGVIGFIPPQTALWEAHAAPGLATEDVLICAAREVPRLRAAGADIVVALCHGGLAPLPHRAGAENPAAALAALPGVDAVIAGHTHLHHPPPGMVSQHAQGEAAPIVLPGFHGSHLGVIDLWLAAHAGKAAGWTVMRAEASLRRAPAGRAGADAEADADAPLRRLLAPHHAATLRRARRRVGRSDVPLGSQLAMLGIDGGLRLIAQAQRWAVRAALPPGQAPLPVLVAVSPFRCGGRGGPGNYVETPAGRLTQGDLADIYCFGNRLSAGIVTGAVLADWLERAAGAFERIVPGGRDQPLLRPDFPAYNFDMIDGLDWRIDLSQPARYAPDGTPAPEAGAGRVSALTHRGRPVAPEARFILASNDYRLSGVGLYAPLTAGLAPLPVPQPRVRDVLAAYLRRVRRVAPPLAPAFQLARVPGATALLRAAPSAGALIGNCGLPLQPAGTDAEGFAVLRLNLDAPG